MQTAPSFNRGDKVAYYRNRRTGAADSEQHNIRDGRVQIRRTGIVQGWREGKVIVLHAAQYTELIEAADLQRIA